MLRRIPFLLFAVSVALGGGPAGAARAAEGWSVGFTHSGFAGEVTLLLAGDVLRASAAGMNQEALLDAEGLTLIDHGDRNYMVVTFAQLDATVGLMADALQGIRDTQRRTLEAALAELEPAERAALQAQLDALGGPTPEPSDFEFRAGEETATLAGLAARKHLVLVRGKPVAEVWLTPAIPLGPLPEIIRRLERLVPLDPEIDPAAVRLLRLADGFPLKLVDLTGSGETLLVHRADRRSFTPADFSPPEGYAEKSLSLDAFRN